MKSDSLASKSFTEIRKKILSNQITPKTRLKENEWAKKLGVSRVSIREALTRLLGEDLVVLGERGGYFVKPLLPEDVHQVRELREVLELGALRLAHKKIKKRDLETLDKICDDFTNMYSKGYHGGALEADMKFHESLVEFAGNAKLLHLYHSSHIPLFHQKIGKEYTSMDDFEQTDTEHRKIVEALKAGDIGLAEKVLVKHFARGEARALSLE
ncbi:MAG TPA: GntR family transcriptional regulator [Parafilimonas sp.]|nr:GntR family transcriptional regulator [Parafilimonas sp.]